MIERIAILPVGSTEYHGDLLPVSTDTIVAERVAKDIAQKIEQSTILPALSYGLSTEHGGFEQTVTIKVPTYMQLILELLESISHENTLIVVVNGHGGNTNILNVIESEYNYAHTTSKVFIPSLYGDQVQILSQQLLGEYDTHAGSVESSLVAYYNGLDYYEDQNPAFVKQMKGSLRFFKTKDVNPLGVIKDTKKLVMDPIKGKKIHARIVKTIVKDIEQLILDVNKVTRHG